MASVFGHIMASTAIGLSFFPKDKTLGPLRSYPALLALAGACACVPDLDVLAFNFGIPYGSPWGHRGASHSIVFSIIWGGVISWIFYRKEPFFWRIFLFFFLSTLSHPLLDACTNGGRGVALFFPIDNQRIFFPWQVIQVSPISPADFFGEWGKSVLISEFKWIGWPGLVLVILTRGLRLTFHDRPSKS